MKAQPVGIHPIEFLAAQTGRRVIGGAKVILFEHLVPHAPAASAEGPIVRPVPTILRQNLLTVRAVFKDVMHVGILLPD
jgi:hypothetical protein